MSQSVEEFPDIQLVLDASALLNFLSCGRCAEILAVFHRPCLIPDKTIAEVQRLPATNQHAGLSLAALVAGGQLSTCQLTEAEYELFLSLVGGEPRDALDTGESAAIAVAARRHVGLVLDDGKARRRVGELFPGVPVVSSLRVIIHAGEGLLWSRTEIAQAIVTAHKQSRMNTVRGEDRLLESYGLRRSHPIA